MILEHLSLLNFKNIAEAELDFSAGVNCFLGMNGQGKSNLLEAIHFLSFARPFSSLPDSALPMHGTDMLLAKGRYRMDAGSEELIACSIVAGKGKTLKLNGKEYQRISQHIGRFPLVTIAPQDHNIVAGPGEERRKLMDMVISQGNPGYLATLIKYNRALESRNRMLRAGVRDALLYESVETAMAEAAASVHESRMKWSDEIAPVLAETYAAIAGGEERATMGYRSVLNDASLAEVLASRRAKDAALGYTSAGPHRDDLETGLGGYSMRRLGSQGQIKTYTIALRLAIFRYLRRTMGETPLLLLDDIFDKLDASRVERIMETVADRSTFGQIFITDTNRKHLDEILGLIGSGNRLFEVSSGAYRLKNE